MTQPKEPLESIVEFGMGVSLEDIAFLMTHRPEQDNETVLQFILKVNSYVGDTEFTRELCRRLNDVLKEWDQ